MVHNNIIASTKPPPFTNLYVCRHEVKSRFLGEHSKAKTVRDFLGSAAVLVMVVQSSALCGGPARVWITPGATSRESERGRIAGCTGAAGR